MCSETKLLWQTRIRHSGRDASSFYGRQPCLLAGEPFLPSRRQGIGGSSISLN